MDPAWTTEPFTEAGNTREEPVGVGTGEKMRSNSVLAVLSLRYFLDSQGELRVGFYGSVAQKSNPGWTQKWKVITQ